MATVAYSSLLGLALPTQGDLTGQWGDEVNDYITKYLDASVAGGLSITADVTLTKTTGSALGATSSQYAILTCSPASVNIVVTAPAAYKIYVVNNTSASYTVTIRGAGPTTGVVLSALEKAVVAWNGTDFFKVATSATDGVSTFSAGSTGLTPSSATSGVVTLAGTLAVANGGTGLTAGTSGGVLAYTATGTLASSTALAASALVIGGGAGAAPSTTTTGTGVVTALGVNTGTAGAFVVNGGALGTPSGGTVTNLTGTASININGTVGATTPGTGAFTTLSASGTSTLVAVNASGEIRRSLVNDAVYSASTLNADHGVSVYNGSVTSNSYASIEFINRASGTAQAGISSVTSASTTSALAFQVMTSNVTSEPMRLTGTGLAVTGTLSATGTLSGGTSGTAYSFSGSAPATSLTLDANGSLAVGGTSVVTSNGGVTATTTSSGSIATSFAMRNAGTANGSGSYLNFRGVSNTSAEHDYCYLAMVADDTTAKTGSIRFSTSAGSSPVERARIDSTGLAVTGALSATQSATGVASYISHYASAKANTWFGFNDSGSDFYQIPDQSSFFISPNVFPITISAGTAAGNITISTTGALVLGGGLKSASGTGITFPATQSASTDANTLDDYEEGTFTPTPSAITVNSGTPVWSMTYTKIGRQVTVTWILTGGANVSISVGTSTLSLPFSATDIAWGSYGNNSSSAFIGGLQVVGSVIYFGTASTLVSGGGTVVFQV